MSGWQSKTAMANSRVDIPDDLKWFADRGHWIIRKVPNTKDEFYVVLGEPPTNVLKIYGIL